MSEQHIHEDGKPVCEGDLFYYSERPYSDYADSVLRVYDDGGTLRVESLVVREGEGRDFIPHFRDSQNDMSVVDVLRYSDPGALKRISVAAEKITPQWANEQYPPQGEESTIAAVNSYARHFGPDAVAAAEDDVLGGALKALKLASHAFVSSNPSDTEAAMGAIHEITSRVPQESPR